MSSRNKSKNTDPPPTQPDYDELVSTIKLMAEKMDIMSNRLSTIEALLVATQTENKQLKDDLVSSAQENLKLQAKLNNLEQYNRSWSVRVVGMGIPSEDEEDNQKVMQHLYDKLLKPILEGAVKKGLMSTIPPVESLLETAHVLPGKMNTKPIIARFFTRNIRSLVFRLKKEFSPKEQAAGSGEPSKASPRQRPKYAIYDDLTKVNFNKMRALAADKRVLACWSVKGQLKFKCHGEDFIRKVPCAFTPVEDLLK